MIKQATYASTDMEASAFKYVFGCQGDIYNSLGQPASGFRIQNMMYAGIILDILEQDDFINSRKFNTWQNHDVSIFEALYDEFCELLDNDGTESHNQLHVYREEYKYGIAYISRFISTSDMTCETKENLNEKGSEYFVPINSILNNQFSPNNEFRMLSQHFTSKTPVHNRSDFSQPGPCQLL